MAEESQGRPLGVLQERNAENHHHWPTVWAATTLSEEEATMVGWAGLGWAGQQQEKSLDVYCRMLARQRPCNDGLSRLASHALLVSPRTLVPGLEQEVHFAGWMDYCLGCTI